MQTLHGYTLDETQWKASGASGQCNIANKDGKKYFIKRLSFPRYPDSDNFRGKYKEQKIAFCNEWFRKRQEIMRAIPGSGSGTTVKPIEYFREGSCYYEVANLIDVTSISYKEIYKESKEDKARILMTVAMSLADMHKKGIVHGDLDPGNILIARTQGANNLITKLIDFTDSFFEDNPPENIMSKEFWWSPEVALYSKAADEMRDPNPYKKFISCKADVFSLGIVFHQLCTKDGRPPVCSSEVTPCWMEYYAKKTPKIDPHIEPGFRTLIADMLECEPSKRPDMAEVHKRLLDILKGKDQSGNHHETDHGNGDSDLKVGPGVKSARRHEKNPQKVVLRFENGKEQIMDLRLAVRQGYVKV